MSAPAQAPVDSAISPQGARPKASKAKRYLVAILVFVVSLAIAYGVGRLQTSGRIDDAVGEREQARAELAKEQQRAARLDARRHLHLALLALDERNFGIAQNELGKASGLLEKSAPPSDSPLAKIAAETKSHRLIATEDLNVQRQKVLVWVKALDAALP